MSVGNPRVKRHYAVNLLKESTDCGRVRFSGAAFGFTAPLGEGAQLLPEWIPAAITNP
jgi:hypothetical protein